MVNIEAGSMIVTLKQAAKHAEHTAERRVGVDDSERHQKSNGRSLENKNGRTIENKTSDL